MTRNTLENNLVYAPRIYGARQGNVRLALTGTFVILPDGPSFYYLDPGAATRNVFLPPITPDAGQLIYIMNLSSTGTLHVVDSNGVAVLDLPGGAASFFASYQPANWAIMATAGTVVPAPVQRLVTTSPITVAGNDQIINCNISSGSPTCQLPLASTRAGKSVIFKDVGGQFAAHNLTITLSGGELLDGLSSLVLATNFQWVQLVPRNDGGSGWFMLS